MTGTVTEATVASCRKTIHRPTVLSCSKTVCRPTTAADKEAFQDSSYLLVGKKGQITVTPWGAVQDRTAELVTNDPQTGEAVRKTLVPGQYLVRNLGAAYRELGAIAEKGGASVSPGREARKTVQIMVGFLNSHQQGSRLVDVPE